MTGYLDARFDLRDAASVSSYDEAWLWSARFGFMLLDRVPLRPGMHVLDVGCGMGFPLFALGAALGPSSRVVGIDPWSAALERAGVKRSAYGMRQAALVRGDGARLPFVDGSFDLVTSNLGVNNFEDPVGAMRECARVLRPGGRLALTTNLQGHMRELYEELRAVLEETEDEAALARLEAHQAHRTTAQRLRSQLETAGFRIDVEARDEFVLRYADGTALFWHWFIRAGFLPAWREVVAGEGGAGAAAERERDVFRRVEGRLNKAAADAGAVRLTVPALYVEAVPDQGAPPALRAARVHRDAGMC